MTSKDIFAKGVVALYFGNKNVEQYFTVGPTLSYCLDIFRRSLSITTIVLRFVLISHVCGSTKSL